MANHLYVIELKYSFSDASLVGTELCFFRAKPLGDNGRQTHLRAGHALGPGSLTFQESFQKGDN